MGWASYLEDIVERLDDDLRSFRTQIIQARVSAAAAPSADNWDTILLWVANAERILTELRNHLDLATDPDSDPAAELIALERRYRTLQQSTGEHESTKREVAKVREDLKRLRKENRDLRERLETAFKANPDAIYGAYSTPEMIRKHRNLMDPEGGTA